MESSARGNLSDAGKWPQRCSGDRNMVKKIALQVMNEATLALVVGLGQ